MARLRRKDIEAMAWMVEQGTTIRSAARVGGCDESTLRYHLRRRAEGAEDGRRRQPEAVGPYAEVADSWIERQREATVAGRRPEAVRRLYEELVDLGYEESYKAVLRYVRRRMEAPRLRPFRRVEVAPGSLVQVDWALRRVWIDELGGEVELSGFMAVLAASRRRALVWSRDRRLLSRDTQIPAVRGHPDSRRGPRGCPVAWGRVMVDSPPFGVGKELLTRGGSSARTSRAGRLRWISRTAGPSSIKAGGPRSR